MLLFLEISIPRCVCLMRFVINCRLLRRCITFGAKLWILISNLLDSSMKLPDVLGIFCVMHYGHSIHSLVSTRWLQIPLRWLKKYWPWGEPTVILKADDLEEHALFHVGRSDPSVYLRRVCTWQRGIRYERPSPTPKLILKCSTCPTLFQVLGWKSCSWLLRRAWMSSQSFYSI